MSVEARAFGPEKGRERRKMDENSIRRGAERPFWPEEGGISPLPGRGYGPEGLPEAGRWHCSPRGRYGRSAEGAMAPRFAPDRRSVECERFLERFPEAAARLLAGEGAVVPREVWLRVRAGEGLAEAYSDYLSRTERARQAAEIERLRLELEELRQERENAARSTGTMYSAGEGEVYDPAAAGWNSV